MTRKHPRKSQGSHQGPRPQPRVAQPAPPSGRGERAEHQAQEQEQEQEEGEDLAGVVMEQLAEKVHPELVLAIQERANAKDPRWLALVSLSVDAAGNVHPLLGVQPVSLNPVRFEVAGESGPASWLVERLLAAFGAFPAQVAAWQARLTHACVVALGEERCAALSRAGMGELIGAVEEALAQPGTLAPASLNPQPLSLPRERIEQLVEERWPLALARTRLISALEAELPNVEEDEIEELAREGTRELTARVGTPPDFPVEIRAGDRPWLPLSALQDALKRRLSGGLRVLR